MSDPIRTALERLLSDIQDLSDYSEGIVGLHRNGDPAPWNELLEGGRYSSWLGDAIAAARAALAEQQGNEAQVSLFVDSHIDPEHQGEDRQILHVFYDACMSEGGTADEIHLRGLRAVLSRWGHQPTLPAELLADLTSGSKPLDPEMAEVLTPEARWDLYAGSRSQPPAEGEVAGLVEWLRETGDLIQPSHLAEHQRYKRTAELLQQFASPPCLVLKPSPEALAALKAAGPGRIELLPDDAQIIKPSRGTLLVPVPAPVPVSERLPGPGDRNTEGGCWWFCTAYPGDWPHWILGNEAFCDPTHWLPAHALPLPQGEVEA